MTIESLRQWISDSQEESFVVEHGREIEDLIGFHLDLSWSEVQLKKEKEIPAGSLEKIKKDLMRLVSGEPLAYILGHKFFYKSNFIVNRDVLIPRPETELLVAAGVDIVGKNASYVIDIGAGTGCIGLSVAKECPKSQVILIEASEKAFLVAQKNLEQLSLSNVACFCSEIGVEALEIPEVKGKVDLILSNPPYIAEDDSRVAQRVYQHEPHQALYAKEKGLFWIHKFLLWGYDYLKKDGLFIFEFGKGQQEDLKNLVEKTNYQFVEFIEDYSGTQRFMKLLK